MPRKAEKYAAVVTIRDASKMTKEGRKEVADWLRQQAKTLVQYGGEMSKVFRARYLYRRPRGVYTGREGP